MLERLCIITDNYPSPQKVVYTFVDQLVCQFADFGINCIVISPQSITKVIIRGYRKLPYYWERVTLVGNTIKVFTPKYISVSTYKKGIINSASITLKNFISAANGIFKKLHKENSFDAVYGHFIFPSGITANYISKKYNIPAFFAYGENTNYSIDYLGVEKTRELLTLIKGVVSVSTANKENLIRQEIVPEDIIGVFPNSIDNQLFYCRDKKEMRKKYDMPEDAFIVAFVGRFIESKGINRLSQALNMIDTDKVKSLFIGDGAVKPNCNGILLQGIQPHNNVPELLSASDIFVLPTLAEGCCNAIIEAMACGLPIISSDQPFNDDILNKENSIRLDVKDVEAIRQAIVLLRDNSELRSKMSKAALVSAESLNIQQRAQNIIGFMESKI